MAKTKYTEDVVTEIVDTMRQTGSVKLSYESAGISRFTYFKWLKDHANFSDRIAIAKQEYRDNLSKKTVERADEVLSEYLYEGAVETWKIEHKGKRTLPSGIEGTEEWTETKVVSRKTPQWVIERIKGKPMQVEDALKCLVENGVLSDRQAEELLQGVLQARENMQQKAREIFGTQAV